MKKLFDVTTKLSYYKVYGECITHRNEKTHIFMNKPVYLEILILKLVKMLMYQIWYDCVKPKHGEKAKLVYMDTDISLSTFHFIPYGSVSSYI